MAKKKKPTALAPAKSKKAPNSDEIVKSSRTAEAALASTKDGLQKTRANSATRGEVRQQTVHQQGHPK
jgi:hypothetical protein